MIYSTGGDIMTQETCLLLETKDNRTFFVNETHIKTLMEFCKTFKIEIYLVQPLEKIKILGLQKLASEFCDQRVSYEFEYKKIKKLFPEKRKSRKEILEESSKIQEFVQNQFLNGKSLSLKELKDKYEKWNLTDACLCQHMARVRKKLTKKGHEFEKIGAGVYRLTS